MDEAHRPISPEESPAGGAESDLADPLFRRFGPDEPRDLLLEEDPWAHRRGEPRLFAFFWTVYVFVAVAGGVLWLARSGGWMLGGYGPAGRIMLVVVIVGATVLWPMVRLSQASPGGRALGAVAADVLVVLLPVQMVVWPMTWLAGWPLPSVSAIAAVFVAWVVLAGGVLTVALGGTALERARDGRLWQRGAWMVVIAAVALIGPLVLAGFRGVRAPEWLPMTSPITSILALTGVGVSGPQQAVSPGQWLSIATVGVVGLGWWVAGAARAALSRSAESA